MFQRRLAAFAFLRSAPVCENGPPLDLLGRGVGAMSGFSGRISPSPAIRLRHANPLRETARGPARCLLHPGPAYYLELARPLRARSYPQKTELRFRPALHPAQPCRWMVDDPAR